MEEEKELFQDAMECFQDELSGGSINAETRLPPRMRAPPVPVAAGAILSELLSHHIINITSEEEGEGGGVEGEESRGEEEGGEVGEESGGAEGEGEGGEVGEETAEEQAERKGTSIGRGRCSKIPHLISIGLNHYKNPKFFLMKTHKTNLLYLESRKWSSDTQLLLRNALIELEGEARKYYPNFKDIDGDTFRNMMLKEAIFLIILFTDYDKFLKGGDGELQNDFVFKTRGVLPNICEDLLMLDNQLPYFVLAKVYVILTNEGSADCLKNLALKFFKQVQFGKRVDANSIAENPKDLLDLFHSSFLHVGREERHKKPSSLERGRTKFWVKNASTLRSNGVTFIASAAGMPLDIEFIWAIGVLKIPTLYIDGRNISVLKNLVAYEQGSRLVKPYFSCLAVFFSNLAATPGDVKLLREAGVIQHQPGNDGMVVSLLRELYEAVECNSDEDCLIKSQVEGVDTFVTSVAGKGISYSKRLLLTNFVPILVLVVVLLLSLSPDNFKHFKIRV